MRTILAIVILASLGSGCGPTSSTDVTWKQEESWLGVVFFGTFDDNSMFKPPKVSMTIVDKTASNLTSLQFPLEDNCALSRSRCTWTLHVLLWNGRKRPETRKTVQVVLYPHKSNLDKSKVEFLDRDGMMAATYEPITKDIFGHTLRAYLPPPAE